VHDELGTPGLARVLAAADAAVAEADDAAAGAARRFRIAARLRAGDGPAIEREHEELQALAATGAIAWTDVQLVAAARALLAGRFADVERLAVDGPDGEAQRAAAAFWTDDVVALDALVDSGAARDVRLVDELRAIAARARRGDDAQARARFDADDFADPVAGPYRAAHLAFVATVAVALGSVHRLATLDAMLREYSGELLVSPVGMVAVDAADSARGSVLSALGRHDDAIACLDGAAQTCRHAGAAVLAIMNGHRQALATARRNGPGDRARAAVLARETAGRARELGMVQDERAALNVLRMLDFHVDL
jgi:hypothetical protein